MAVVGYVRHSVTDWNGRAIQNAAVHVYETGTTTPVDLFDSAGVAIDNPVITNNQGEVTAYVEENRVVDLVITDNGNTAIFAPSGGTADFTDQTETFSTIPFATVMVQVVEHGAVAATPRPSEAVTVYWKGSVEPDNMIAGDLWIEVP